jgi:adenylate cyclase
MATSSRAAPSASWPTCLAPMFPPSWSTRWSRTRTATACQATNREMTVMFCDMRGFTKMSEQMEPLQLQALAQRCVHRLTRIIRANRGTIDKYMGDCVMAFWGAPVETPDHAHLAVKSAMEMANAVRGINEEHRAKGMPEIGIGIGVNTGTMCVGDMGSNIRRSYTVIGDAVNLGSRLEGLSKIYGVDIVVSESTRKLATGFGWQELDRVASRARTRRSPSSGPWHQATGLAPRPNPSSRPGQSFLKAYRAQDWDQCDRADAEFAANECQKVPVSPLLGSCSLHAAAAIRPRMGRCHQF